MSITVITFILFILLFYGGSSYYIGKRIFQWLSFLIPNINVKTYICIFALLASSIIIARLPIYNGIKVIMSGISSYVLGIILYLLMFFLLADLVLFLGRIIKIIPTPMPQSIRFYAGLVCILLTTGLVSYGIYNASKIKHVSYEIQTEKLSTELKIVLISDLHLGSANSEKNLKNVVLEINDLKPDIVCIAGDIFNDDYYTLQNPIKAIEAMNSIRATYGVYASLGNHDGGTTFNEMVHFLEQSNIILLNDENVIIDERLALFGRVDPSPIGGFGELKRKDITESLASINPNIPIVVMDHTPSDIEQYGSEVDLVLSGHTHKGQMFPANLITKAVFVVDYGHYQKDAESPNFIVTSGAGTWWMPMRIGSNSEIVSILLH